MVALVPALEAVVFGRGQPKAARRARVPKPHEIATRDRLVHVDAPCGLQVETALAAPFCHDRNEFGVRVEILFSRMQKKDFDLDPEF
jgi:hypothetical protein